MTTKLKILAAFAGFSLVSCVAPVEDALTLPDSPSELAMTKVAKFNDCYDQSSVLIKFQSVPTQEFLGQLTSKNGARFEKLFPSTPGKEELEARFGLDRWYIASDWQTGDVDAIAKDFAQLGEVSMVQYNHLAQKSSDCQVYGADALTKAPASDLSFNDPLLVDQWHYHNTGNASITTSVTKGADINVKDVWAQLTCGDPEIIVAVVGQHR